MKKPFFGLLALIILIVNSGCSNQISPYKDNKNLETIVHEFSETADQCLYDTRDSCIKYEDSRFCKSLGDKAEAYLLAGGGTKETPLKYEIIRERGRTSARMAKAISKSNCDTIFIR